MQSNFYASLIAVLKHEGGYVNNPRDPGGPTNKGITLTTARLYIDKSMTIAQLKALTTTQAGIVYRKQYADVVRFDDLPAGVDYAAFDYAVNSGPGRPIAVLRQLVGQKYAKGAKLEQSTIVELSKREPTAIIKALCDERMAFLRRLKTWSTFGVGWTRRVSEVRTLAASMAAVKASTPQNVIPQTITVPDTEPAQGKAVASAAAPATVPVTGTAVATASAAAAVQSTWHLPAWGIAALVGVALVVAVAIIVYIVNHFEHEQDRPSPGTPVLPVA